MKDKGIDKSSVMDFDTSSKAQRGWPIFGFRKMFWDYLKKLHVPFFDECCEEASTEQYPVRYNSETGTLQYFNGTTWTNLPFDAVNPTTTTTTTTSTTTTTTII